MVGFNNDDYIRNILGHLQKIDYIKPDEIPNIDLYMDQVTTFMDEHLKSSKRYEEDKLLTKTMINNYTKNNLLPPPVKKKYSKEHMLLLIFIYYFKNILSISDIQNMFEPLTEKFYNNKEVNLETIYNEVFELEKEQIDVLIKDVIKKFSKSKETFADPKFDKDREFLNTFSFICMLSFDVYVKKTMIERLIDQSVAEMNGKNKNKKAEPKKTE
ncbi:uncharacterized protein DUF1836 [Mobilisporobacter senegalensis]|uniref:Uncharacterized protein DUF1836 n=1 Tax=Mobilisporobacter senegalensis TaxID=1329262 RepID=A0A3N1XSI5_9FIRM|nr:DUF1836 domain-containing protein [Mobilisporobacter senegalensis]ROR28142.1 uncharacterized protein DUF1836 [Mobilisporobacter senegalensis]